MAHLQSKYSSRSGRSGGSRACWHIIAWQLTPSSLLTFLNHLPVSQNDTRPRRQVLESQPCLLKRDGIPESFAHAYLQTTVIRYIFPCVNPHTCHLPQWIPKQSRASAGGRSGTSTSAGLVSSAWHDMAWHQFWWFKCNPITSHPLYPCRAALTGLFPIPMSDVADMACWLVLLTAQPGWKKVATDPQQIIKVRTRLHFSFTMLSMTQTAVWKLYRLHNLYFYHIPVGTQAS